MQPGRHAQPGARYPSGKLKPENRNETGYEPAVLKRIADRAVADVKDARVGSTIGRMMIRKEITAVQMSAGIRYARLWGGHDRIVGTKPRPLQSPDYGATVKRGSGKAPSERTIAAVRRRVLEVEEALRLSCWRAPHANAEGIVTAGAAARARQLSDAGFDHKRRLLGRVLLEDQACAWFELDVLRSGLDVLAMHFKVRE